MIVENYIPQANAEMKKLFLARERKHKLLVRRNLLLMEGYLDLSLNVLNEAATQHDCSKLVEPERTAYIWMTWMYHCKNNQISFTYPDGIESIVIQGWQHHLQHNLHHPEAHPIPDAMSHLHIVEMVCDWTAISQENNLHNGSCLPWASENIDMKWNFSMAKKRLIFATIHELDLRNLCHVGQGSAKSIT